MSAYPAQCRIFVTAFPCNAILDWGSFLIRGYVMKKLFALTAVAAMLAGSTAFAADAIIYNEPVPVAPLPVSAFNWAGGYVGLHAGYGWGRQSDNQSEAFPAPVDPVEPEPEEPPLPADRFDVDGFVGGVHAGYNWQNGSFVYGVEGDFDYANVKGGQDFIYGDLAGRLSMESEWQGSLRLRAGYAVDTWLFYGTGGLAFARAELTAEDAAGSVSDSNTHTGWTVGAGVEKAFTQNLIGRLEARYTDFGDKSYDLGRFGSDIKSDWHQTTVTVGLSYKF